MSHIDPGNAGGSVPIPDPPRGRHHGEICPHCRLIFRTTLGLTNHIHMEHPAHRPALIVNGTPAGERLVIRQQAHPVSVEFTGSTEALLRIDGAPPQSVSADTLRRVLEGSTYAHLHLRLLNHSGSADCEIVIDIPREADLDQADAIFQQYFGSERPTIDALQRFCDRIKQNGPDTAYSCALGDYVLAVLIKDRSTGIERPFADYRDRFGEALSVLADFSRPLASALTASARLALNDFDKPFRLTVSSFINRGVVYFQERLRRGETAATKAAQVRPRFAVPLDGTLREILDALEAGLPRIAHTDYRPRLNRLEAMSRSEQVSIYDRVKLRVLLADTFLHNPAAGDARAYLNQLAEDPDFGGWAVSAGARL